MNAKAVNRGTTIKPGPVRENRNKVRTPSKQEVQTQAQRYRKFQDPTFKVVKLGEPLLEKKILPVEQYESVIDCLRAQEDAKKNLRILSETKFMVLNHASVVKDGASLEFYDFVDRLFKSAFEGDTFIHHRCTEAICKDVPKMTFTNFVEVLGHMEVFHAPDFYHCRFTECDGVFYTTTEFAIHFVLDHMFDQIIDAVRGSAIFK